MQQISKAKLSVDYATGEWAAYVLTTPDLNGLIAAYVVTQDSAVYEEYDACAVACIAPGEVFDYALTNGTKVSTRVAREVFGADARDYRT